MPSMPKQSKQQRLAELSAKAVLTEADCPEISSMGNAREVSLAPGAALPGAAFALPGNATKFLTITASKVTPRHLADLARWPVLERLVLQECRLEDEQSLAALTDAPRLKGLWLNGCNVTDAALRHAGRMVRLESLLLDKTGITDAGLAELAALRGLKWLGADDTAVTDAGLMHLAGLTRLSSVVTNRTAVTKAGKDALFAAQQANRQAERRQVRAAAAPKRKPPRRRHRTARSGRARGGDCGLSRVRGGDVRVGARGDGAGVGRGRIPRRPGEVPRDRRPLLHRQAPPLLPPGIHAPVRPVGLRARPPDDSRRRAGRAGSRVRLR
jgi:hypothetical protein